MFDNGVSGTKPEFNFAHTDCFGHGFRDRIRYANSVPNSHSQCVSNSERASWV